MMHIELAEGTGELRPPLRDELAIAEHPAQRGRHRPELATRRPLQRRMKPEGGRITTDNVSRVPLQRPWTVLTTDNASRAPTQKPPSQSSVQMQEFRLGSRVSNSPGWLGSATEGRRPQVRGRCSGGSLALPARPQPPTVDREPWTVLTTENVSRAPTQRTAKSE
jgi:hypothetical protein